MLRIHLFGHLRLDYNGQPVKFAALPKTLPLWGYLLLHRDKPVPRDTLAFTLWPDVSESEARANLRRHLHELRRVLPPAPEDIPWILSHGNSLQWNPIAAYWLDVAEFDRLSDLPDQLAEAVELYDGDLLHTVYEDWIFFEREQLRNRFFADLTQLIAQYHAQGNYGQAIAYALQLLGHDPMREDITRELMMLRYESGDRAGAIQEYQRFEERLQEELGVKPMQETHRLYDLIVKNEPLPGRGEGREARSEERRGQDTLSRSSPFALHPIALPHNLPAQLTTFIGREEELATVKGFIGAESAVRLLTLTGPGGTGKTRLSIEAGAQLVKESADLFPDGIFFVGLAVISDPAFVVTAVAETLKISDSPGQTLAQSVQNDLRPKKLLLILDNFEQVVEAAAFVTDLLTAAPGLRIIVTSRILLHLYGEQEYPVPPLPLPDLAALPQTAELLRYAAVALFVERVRATQPAFTLTNDIAATVAEICVRLDGLPLALELAAARSKLFPLPTLLAQLSNRLRFLVGQARNLSARQQTLRSTIDWSYTLLTPEEKRLFAYLSVFSGVFTLEAAVSVISEQLSVNSEQSELFTDNWLLLTSSLVDQSMIRQLPATEADPQPHFRMLLTIREYAQEKLVERGEVEVLRLHHANYYLSLTQQARKAWNGEAQGIWMSRLKTAEDNIRAALVWTLQPTATAENALIGAQIALALRPIWHTRGQMNEARDWYTRALGHRTTFPPEIQVSLLHAASWQAVLQDDYATAEPLQQEALRLAQQLEDPGLMADALAYLGSTAARQQNYELAAQYLTETVALDRQTPGDNSYNLSASLSNLAVVCRRLNYFDKAAALWQEALELARASGNQLREADVLENLAELAVLQENYEKAGESLRQGLVIRHTLDSKVGIMSCLRVMAHLAFAQKDYGRSAHLYTASEALRHDINMAEMPNLVAEITQNLATIRQNLGEAAFMAACAEGEGMTLDEVVAYALSSYQ